MQSLETIALRRRALGLTQSQLAGLSGVSQSYIAKLEAGKIEPSYSKVQAIFEALFELEQGRETKAGEIMTGNVCRLNPMTLFRMLLISYGSIVLARYLF